MRISRSGIHKTFDSRGAATLTVVLCDREGREYHADVPAGKSVGSREAKVAPYEAAVRSLKKVEPRLYGSRFDSVGEFDRLLLELDGTPDKSGLGGNLTLALSVAASRAIAAEKELEPWQAIREEYFPEEKNGRLPLIFSNLVNGGAHAANKLNIQEYMVVVQPSINLSDSVERLIRFYQKLGDVLGRRSGGRPRLGDEGGYDSEFKDNFEPIAILERLIISEGLKNFDIALDAAASGFYRKGSYRFGQNSISAGQLAKTYVSYFRRSKHLMSIEDPFAENDLEAWAAFGRPGWVVGDDLTTTDPGQIKLNASHISAVIIKPNQIGTVSEACEAIRTARKLGLKVIVSHRSGETGDLFIVHLARASGADAVKIGAPARERMIKFNELIRVYG